MNLSLSSSNPGEFPSTSERKNRIEKQKVLGTSSQFVPDGFDGWLQFQFPDAGLMVTPGDTCIIALEDTGETTFGWRYADGTYPSGNAIMLRTDEPSYDFFFRINR